MDYTRKGRRCPCGNHAARPRPAGVCRPLHPLEQCGADRESQGQQLAREIEAALPRELSREQQLALVRAYVKENFVDKGMCADFAIHDKGNRQPPCSYHVDRPALKRKWRMGRKVPQGIRPGRERPAYPGWERRLRRTTGGHHRLERQRGSGDLAGGMGGLYQPGIGGRRSSRSGRPPQLQATGH